MELLSPRPLPQIWLDICITLHSRTQFFILPWCETCLDFEHLLTTEYEIRLGLRSSIRDGPDASKGGWRALHREPVPQEARVQVYLSN